MVRAPFFLVRSRWYSDDDAHFFLHVRYMCSTCQLQLRHPILLLSPVFFGASQIHLISWLEKNQKCFSWLGSICVSLKMGPQNSLGWSGNMIMNHHKPVDFEVPNIFKQTHDSYLFPTWKKRNMLWALKISEVYPDFNHLFHCIPHSIVWFRT